MSKRLGQELARLRKAAGLRQEDVGERFGVGQSSVSDWETGATMPAVTTLTSLFECYLLPPERWADTLRLAQDDEAAPTEAA